MPTLETERIVPRSALRYKPSATEQAEFVHLTQRASRQQQKHQPHTTGGLPFVYRKQHRSISLHWAISMSLAMLLTFTLIWLFQVAGAAWTIMQNDLTYGRPRTMHLQAVVGHEAEKNTSSHFIAINLAGRAHVIEMPGGDASRARVFMGPMLSGENADLVPVILQFVDHTGDGAPEMVILFGGIETRYKNEKGTFVPF